MQIEVEFTARKGYVKARKDSTPVFARRGRRYIIDEEMFNEALMKKVTDAPAEETTLVSTDSEDEVLTPTTPDNEEE